MKLEIDIPSIIYNDAKENRGYISVGKMEIAWKAIADGKPQEQEPRKGHWIETKENSTNTRGQIIHEVVCSECNGIAYFRSMGDKYIGANICPNCGAKMESEG